MVRGFGWTIGKAAANGALKSLNKQNKNQEINWSSEGYTENDDYVTFDHSKKTDSYYGFTLVCFIIFSFIPYLGMLFILMGIPQTFFKKFYTHWFVMKWKTYQYSDRRFTDGIREERKLEPEHVESDLDLSVNYQRMRIIWFILFILQIYMINITK